MNTAIFLRPLAVLVSVVLFALTGCGESTDDHVHPDADNRWVPDDPVAWFTADYDDSIHTAGDDVDWWEDLAGNFDAVNEIGQTTPTLSSIDDNPSVYFDGDGLQLSGAEDIFRDREQFAILAVYRPETNQNQSSLVFYNSTADSPGLRRATLGYRSEEDGATLAGRRNDSDDIVRIFSDNAPPLGEPLAQVNEFDHASDEARLRINGETTVESPFLGTGPTDDTSSVGTYIGTNSDDARRLEDVHVHEIIVYQRLPSEDEVDAFFDHARDHWGVGL